MKISEFESLSAEELHQKLHGLKKELFDLRMRIAGGKLDKPHRIKLIRRDVARIETLLTRRNPQSVKVEKGSP